MTVFDNVNFRVQKGEVIGIIGPNGSGKSTLLKVIAGVTKPSSGALYVKGSVASLLDIGAGFHPDLSGRENVLLMGQLQGISKKQSSPLLQDIIDFSGIGEFIDVPVKNYSKGMYLRLAFSTMIHLPFDVYLLDEVLSVGDAQFQSKCRRFIQRLALSREKIIFVISHNYNELKELCTSYFTFYDQELYSFDHLDAFFSFQASNTSVDSDEKYDIWKHGILMQRPYEFVSCNVIKKGGFDYADSIPIEIQISRLLSPTQFGISVKDEFQQTVFQTYFKEQLNPCEKVAVRIDLPSTFFNQGTYEVDVFCFRSEQLSVIESNVVSFEVKPFTHENSISIRTWGPTKPDVCIQSIDYEN